MYSICECIYPCLIKNQAMLNKARSQVQILCKACNVSPSYVQSKISFFPKSILTTGTIQKLDTVLMEPQRFTFCADFKLTPHVLSSHLKKLNWTHRISKSLSRTLFLWKQTEILCRRTENLWVELDSYVSLSGFRSALELYHMVKQWIGLHDDLFTPNEQHST